MNRNIESLSNKKFDVVIIGGGIFGICTAWDATLRGLTVALLERGDFSHAASANCFKFVHGGIRYLQHLDIQRVRESSRERNILLRIAPHLVAPISVVIPTYGYGSRNKLVLRIARALYNLLAYDKNNKIQDGSRLLPNGKNLSREQCLDLFPGIENSDLTGAITFYDAQMYSPSRLAISYLKSAVSKGTIAANYTEVTGFLSSKNNIYGVRARDICSDKTFEVQGRIVINAAGPWSESLLSKEIGLKNTPKLSYSKDTFIVLKKQLFSNHSLGIKCSSKDADSLFKSEYRHLFLAPWNGKTIIGVWHNPCDAPSQSARVTKDELYGYIEEINESYPALSLCLDDIACWNAGYVLFGKNNNESKNYSFGKRSVLIDHEKQNDISGLITLVGVRYTTSRLEAERTVDLVFKKLGRRSPKCNTSDTPISGGDIKSIDTYLDVATNNNNYGLNPPIIQALIYNYGTEHNRVLNYIKEDENLSNTLNNTNVLRAEIVHAAREEMVQKLSDVIFRRTDLGTAGTPGSVAISECAGLVGRELGWDDERIKREIDEVNSEFVF